MPGYPETMDSEHAEEQGLARETRGPDRRQRTVSLVLRERRRGFDRRCPRSPVARAAEGVLLYLRDRQTLFLALLLAVNVLNLADMVATLKALSLGAEEANPIMRFLLEGDPYAALSVKTAIVAAATGVVWRLRRFRSALAIGLTMIAWFTLVMLYQIAGMIYLVS